MSEEYGERPRSVFWSLLVVFLALALGNGVQFVNLWKQREQLKKQGVAIEAVLPQAQRINSTLVGIGNDLIALSSNNPSAHQIAQEFNLRSNSPQGAPAP